MTALASIWVVCGAVVAFAPLATLLHELGHAFAVRRITGQRPTVIVGDYPPMIRRSYRSFDLFMSLKMTEHAGTCTWDPDGVTIGQTRTILAAGPWVSALGAFLAAAVAAVIAEPSSIPFWIAVGLFLTEVGSAIYNLLPHGASDGAKLLRLRGYASDTVIRRRERLPPS